MNKIKYILMAGIALTSMTSCDDLDQYPEIETTSEQVYTTVDNYKSVLGKLYNLYCRNGQTTNENDLSSNKGECFMRCYLNLQDVCTDELVYSWIEGDNMSGIHNLSWDNQDVWVADTYYWCYYTITMCNEFIRNVNSTSGYSDTDMQEIKQYGYEARFIRAFAYWQVLDLYRKGSFVTENDPIGAYIPEVADATKLFNFIESELKEISEVMKSRTEQEYGRAPRAAAWMLLTRLYLNAEVYGQSARYNDCITYCQKVIDEGYTLCDDYAKLFNADNDKRFGEEIIFSLQADADKNSSWGASTYVVCGCLGMSMVTADYGVASGWGMWRATSQMVNVYNGDANDVRNNWYTTDQTLEITDSYDASQGYLFMKWTNLTDNGETASETSTYGVDTDYPLFRVAEAYITLAEATLRNNGSNAIALENVNKVRARAHAADLSTISLNDILDERMREFALECQRRTDLVRFNKFTAGNWDLGPKDRDAKYNYYPIPLTELTANPNIKNTEY